MRGPYLSATLPVEQRLLMADIAEQLVNRGWLQSDVVALFDDIDRPIPPSTLSRWLSLLRSGSSILSSEKRTGAERKISLAQEQILVGFVFYQYRQHQELDWDGVVRFVNNDLGVSLSDSRVIQICLNNGFSTHRAKGRHSGSAYDVDVLVEKTFDLLKDWHASVLKLHPSLIYSFDWTYTKNFRKSVKTISPDGFRQPSVHVPNDGVQFTDCYATCCRADGGLFSAVLFSANENVDPKGRNKAEVLRLCEKWGVDTRDIFYLRENRETFTRENPDMLYNCLRMWDIKPQAVVLSDDGSFWRVGPVGEKTDIFLEYFSDHRVYLPATHHKLSPNDNHWHGVAKQRFKAAKREAEEPWSQVERAIALMHFLDSVEHDMLEQFFVDNLFLGREFDEDDVRELIGNNGREQKAFPYYEQCEQEYLAWLNEAEEIGTPRQGQGGRGKRVQAMLASSLDGQAWKRK